MPDKYISCEAALMKLMQDGCSAKNLQSISDMPAADVAVVRHGRWIHHEDGVFLVVNAATQNLTTAIIADYAGRRWMELPNERTAV